MEGTAEVPHQIADALLPQPNPVFDDTPAFDTAVDRLHAPSAIVQSLVGQLLFQGEFLAAGFLRRQEDLALGQREGQQAPILPQPAPSGPGSRRRGSKGLIMDATAIGVAAEEDREQGMDQENLFDRIGLGLAALTVRLCRRVVGADDPPGGPVMGTRGDADAAAGPVLTGAGASSSGTTPVAASASETPSRCARAGRVRAGASPRVRSAASSAGRRTCIYGLAVLWTIPNKRPWTTWRAEVLRSVRRKNRRASGVGQGQVVSTGNRRAVRGFPSSRHAAIRAWNAASKGGTSCGNASRVRLVQSRHSIGRDGSAVNRQPAMGCASWHCIVMSEAHHTRKKAG
jgi:hypothetical protein